MANIKDVAALAGVSIATVSRTLSNPEKVAESTRNRVMEAIEKSGYVANSLARNFRRRRSHMVVVLVPDISNSFFGHIIQGIEAVAGKHGYRILLGDTRNDPQQERIYAEMVQQKQADGIICLGRNIPFDYDKRRKTLDPEWPPFAMACEYHGEIPVPTVCIDNFKAAESAVNHLLELGHRRIALINGPSDSPLCEDRLLGYQQALATAKLKPQPTLMKAGDFSLDSGMLAMQQLLKLKQRPTAVFCTNDAMAIGAMQACRDAGLRLPGQMSIVGFDDIRFSAYTQPRLTTVHQPRTEIGKAVMNMMLGMLADDKDPVAVARIVLPHRLVVRESSVAPPKSA